MENELSYSMKRHLEQIMGSPFIEPNKQTLIKYIEMKAKSAKGYFYGMTLLINILKEINDIDLSKLTEEQMKETFDRLNNLRWEYSSTTFTALKQIWVNFLQFVKIEYTLKIDPKAEAKVFNIKQRSKFMTITKPIGESNGN